MAWKRFACFWEARLFLPLWGGMTMGASAPWHPLSARVRIPAFSRCRRVPPHAGCGQVWVLPGIAPEVHRIVPLGPAMVWTFIPWTRCLPEK